MNIFVSNLSYGVSSENLREVFSEYGEVSSAKVIEDRETNRSRGFGFVEMSDADGQKAIDGLNQAEYDGKVMSVSVARPKENSGGGSYGGGGGNRGGGGFGGNRRSY
jgi:RNA recognition motif-containing protein